MLLLVSVTISVVMLLLVSFTISIVMLLLVSVTISIVMLLLFYPKFLQIKTYILTSRIYEDLHTF